MVHYKNSYSKDEDPMLWNLHEIRHKIAEQNQSPEQINIAVRDIIRQHRLDNLKLVNTLQNEIKA
ncbi:MAG: hypothetical protein HQK77_08620 [Desulfobacterales bacterium]|nr:hypothetical protein [Desulfobacterales bacterium]